MPAQPDLDRLRSIKTLPSLIAYLRDELDWPIEADETEDVKFDYDPEELGFDTADAVHIKEIKQLRPLAANQPWGIFWVNLEKKRLPVVMLRRILAHLVLKKRATANKASQRAWHLHDLLFISAYGEENDRAVTFAHFSQDAESPGDLPTLKVLGWDDRDTVLHLADAHRTLAEKLRWPAPPANVDAWRSQWGGAFTLRHREVITTTTELVEELARLADATRRRARTILARESERGPLRRLYAAFKTALIHDLTEDDFADLIAQTISYGLLITRFSRAAISAQNLVDMVPATNPFLRELLGTFLALAGRQSAFDFDELGIQDVVEVLNRSNAAAVKADFGNRTRNEDPVIHFYEHFLAAYDRQKKIQRGVFYTPQPAVSYIVRGVHELLQKEFGIEDGLASTITWGDMLKAHPDLKLPKIRVPKPGKAEGAEVDLPLDEFFVMILDIATGTGTFLVETIEAIFQHLQAKWEKHGLQGMPIIRHSALRIPSFKDYWNAYVPAALLPRLYGYELMMAPYTIAHMKLALKFSEINARLGQADYLFKFEGRANIYLTNTLEPASGFQEQEFADFFPALAHEAAAVNTVKRTKRFTVAMGNPPYAQYSMNLNDAAKTHIEKFRFANGQRIRARNALQLERNLNDDYVKFLGFSSGTLPQGTGVLGVITNRMFLDSESLVGLREWFAANFDRLCIVDLWGSSEESRRVARLAEDENVFDILQGVAISFAVRRRQRAGTANEVRYREVIGRREAKYRLLRENLSFGAPGWAETRPEPEVWSLHRSVGAAAEAEHEFTLAEIFPQFSTLVASNRDHLVVGFDREVVFQNVRAVQSFRGSNEELSRQFDITLKTGWNITAAREKLAAIRDLSAHIQTIEYRPFDRRSIFFHPTLVWQTAPVSSNNVQRGRFNRVLVSLGKNRAETTNGHWVTKTLSDKSVVSTRDNASGFPLYLYDDEHELNLSNNAGHPNLSPAFLKHLTARLGLAQIPESGLPQGVTPEDIFHYTYGVLNSPGYRIRYAEFLKTDFPRLPLTGSLELFRALARLGGELVALDLLESPELDKPITEYIGGRSPEVEKASWSKNTVWLDKAQTTGFKGVREHVWNFHIGGYQVCEKWLKDRKGRNLSADDRAHYQKIVAALSETIRLMQEIDQVIEKHGGWPLK
jgi:predicted helicase